MAEESSGTQQGLFGDKNHIRLGTAYSASLHDNYESDRIQLNDVRRIYPNIFLEAGSGDIGFIRLNFGASNFSSGSSGTTYNTKGLYGSAVLNYRLPFGDFIGMGIGVGYFYETHNLDYTTTFQERYWNSQKTFQWEQSLRTQGAEGQVWLEARFPYIGFRLGLKTLYINDIRRAGDEKFVQPTVYIHDINEPLQYALFYSIHINIY